MGIDDAGNIVGMRVDGTGQGSSGYYWNHGDSTGGFSSETGLFLPTAGIVSDESGDEFTAGTMSDIGSYLHVGVDAAPNGIDPLSPGDATSAVLGLNEELLVGQSGDKAFIFDLTTHALFSVNDFSFATPGFGQILRLTDINNSNQFIGVALIDGIEHGIVGQFVPEPSMGMGLTVGAIIVALRKRRLLSNKSQ